MSAISSTRSIAGDVSPTKCCWPGQGPDASKTCRWGAPGCWMFDAFCRVSTIPSVRRILADSATITTIHGITGKHSRLLGTPFKPASEPYFVRVGEVWYMPIETTNVCKKQTTGCPCTLVFVPISSITNEGWEARHTYIATRLQTHQTLAVDELLFGPAFSGLVPGNNWDQSPMYYPEDLDTFGKSPQKDEPHDGSSNWFASGEWTSIKATVTYRIPKRKAVAV